MTDLSSFNIMKFAGGQQNLKIVDESAVLSGSDSGSPLMRRRILRAPLNLSRARTVLLSYSIFFPATFDFVKGGKLPGMYGGHEGCSGGNKAEDCFSTRLMWREGGAGELYLYAPKNQQTASLCSDSQSVCDAAWGLSIGRGSFTFNRGEWTRVRQIVRLNTPGVPDGGFELWVEGRRVIQRGDVYYRGTGTGSSGSGSTTTPGVTFFGGHEKEWASPRDQYVWFKGFEMERIA
ncbi:hypothetical protein BDP27DRAFT_1385655 [Rhodocollybia butyracea]|uniref:Polysaccharide lyase 14 domain-containing protein n=1 Tax=Rhodocollybia butyracea TaxID=206335 RepID=A0A9P5PBT2_9AGAR|nr:hypothetical protein BDP27DRAFT_1385655 [Rhodocollybia butyracea]